MIHTAPCLTFYSMQMIRLFMIFVVLVVWGLNFYVNVKKCIMYLNFWALTFTLLYLLWVLPTAGRQEIERQLEERKQLENEERSTSWKKAFFFYTIAVPLTTTSTVVFTFFFLKDQICATYFDFGVSYWRAVVVVLATYTPMVVLILDLSINRIPIAFKHLALTIGLLALYFLVTLIGSSIQDRPVYG